MGVVNLFVYLFWVSTLIQIKSSAIESMDMVKFITPPYIKNPSWVVALIWSKIIEFSLIWKMNRFVNIEFLKFSRKRKMTIFKSDLQKLSLQSDARVVTDPNIYVFHCFPRFWTLQSKQSSLICVCENTRLLHATFAIKKYSGWNSQEN